MDRGSTIENIKTESIILKHNKTQLLQFIRCVTREGEGRVEERVEREGADCDCVGFSPYFRVDFSFIFFIKAL